MRLHGLSAKDPLSPNLEGHNVKIGSRKGCVCLVMLRSKDTASMFLALRLRNRWVFTWSVHIGQAIVKPGVSRVSGTVS